MQTSNGTSTQEAANTTTGANDNDLPLEASENPSNADQQIATTTGNNSTTNTASNTPASSSSSSSAANQQQQQQQQSPNSMATAGLTSNHVMDNLVHQQPNTSPQSGGSANNPTATTTTTSASSPPGSVTAAQAGSGSNYQQSHQQRGPPYHHGNVSGNQYQPQHHQNAKYNSHHRGDNESNINHVLLITVINPHYYPITCDLIHHICNNWGKVNRIVIFKKNGVQAMVEFDSVESAKRAKTNLHGCDIYSGCCTLRIEYAKPTRLNVHKNGNDSFDYTNPTLGSGGNQGGNQQQQDGTSSNLNEHLPVPTAAGGGNGQPGAQHHQQLYSSPPQHGHHQPQAHRGGLAGGGRGRGIGSGAVGQHHGQHQQNFHPSHPHNPHLQQHSPHGKPGEAPSAAGYAMQSHTPLDAAGGPSAVALAAAAVAASAAGGDPTAAFHQDGGFNVSRGGPPPSGYIEPYGLAAAHGGAAPPHGSLHGPAGILYPRQDGGAHHHPHHSQRSSMGPGGAGGGGVLGSANHNHSPFATGNVATNALMSGPGNMGPPQGTVMMVYGLQPERVNCDRLFNLFCLYGNVIKIKFLRTKEGCAMVQMGDSLAVDRCVSSLNKTTLFGNELQISYSKQPFLHDVVQPFILPDGSPSFKEFTNNKNNRFKHPEVASKNRILPPSHVLHFFSAPFGITEDELVHLFKQTAGHEPVSLKIFTPKGDNTKSYSGLVTFRDSAEATETLVLCNHMNMPRPGAPHPYILRLCFSPPTYPRPNPYVQAQSSQ